MGTERDRVKADIATRLRKVKPECGRVSGASNGASSALAILLTVVRSFEIGSRCEGSGVLAESSGRRSGRYLYAIEITITDQSGLDH